MPNFVDDHYEYEQNGIMYKGYMISDDGKLPYLLVVPDDMKDGSEMIVESLNRENDKDGDIAGFDSRSLDSSFGAVRRILNSVNNAPIIIPIVPSKNGEPYYQQLSHECIEGKAKSERIDIQYLECIESAKEKVKEITKKNVADKVFLNGYSASAVFAQRFAMAHPEIVSKCCVGGAIGSIPIPDDKLPWPLGIKDFEKLFGEKFDAESYKKIVFAYYVGEHEASRPGDYGKDGNFAFSEIINKDGKPEIIINNPEIPVMPMHDMSYHPRSMSAEIGKMQRQEYGETMQDRLESAIDYYKQNGYDFKSKIYRDVAHNDVRYRNIGKNDPNIRDNIAYFGIFSDHPSVADVSQRVFEDIREFYETGNGFENDDKSVQKLDLHEQEQRDAYAKEHRISRLEQLENEQQSLILALSDREKKYEQVKEQMKGKDTYEKSE